jgi:hypothetical protein
VALLLLFAVESCDEEQIVREEAARDERVVDAMNRLAAAVESESLIDGDVADHFAVIIWLARDNFNGKLAVVVVGDGDHLRVVRLNDVAHLEKLARNAEGPLVVLSRQTKASDGEFVLVVFERLVAANGDCRLRIVRDDDLDDREADAGVELKPIRQVVEHVFVAHQVGVAFLESVVLLFIARALTPLVVFVVIILEVRLIFGY